MKRKRKVWHYLNIKAKVLWYYWRCILNVQEFLGILSKVSRGTIQEKLQWIFGLYDLNKDGLITKTEMLDVVTSIYEMLGHHTEPQVEENSAREHVEKIFHVSFSLHWNRTKTLLVVHFIPIITKEVITFPFLCYFTFNNNNNKWRNMLHSSLVSFSSHCTTFTFHCQCYITFEALLATNLPFPCWNMRLLWLTDTRIFLWAVKQDLDLAGLWGNGIFMKPAFLFRSWDTLELRKWSGTQVIQPSNSVSTHAS